LRVAIVHEPGFVGGLRARRHGRRHFPKDQFRTIAYIGRDKGGARGWQAADVYVVLDRDSATDGNRGATIHGRPVISWAELEAAPDVTHVKDLLRLRIIEHYRAVLTARATEA
jgi:hypothetical protein